MSVPRLRGDTTLAQAQAAADSRVQMTIRLNREDKAFFAERAAECGLEAGVAVRQLVELFTQRMRRGGDYIDAMHELKSIWHVPTRSTDSGS